LKAWTEWHNFCLSSNVERLKLGVECIEKAREVQLKWPDDPENDTLTSLLTWSRGFHFLARLQDEKNLPLK